MSFAGVSKSVLYFNKFSDLFEGKIDGTLLQEAVNSIAMNDPAHNLGHVFDVCELTKTMCAALELTERQTTLCLLGALLHDIGCRLSRDDHHIVGYGMTYVILDKYCRDLFTPFEVKTIATAVLEHRSSNKHKPSNLIAEVVSVADSGKPNIQLYVKRALQFRISRGDLERLDKEGLFKEVVEHLREKFMPETGYHWNSYPDIGMTYFKEHWEMFCRFLKDDNLGALWILMEDEHRKLINCA